MIVHLTAHAAEGLAPFRDHEQARWIWCRLRSVFPRALGCTLMHDHLHLLPEVDSPKDARVKLGVILRSFTRKFPRGRRIFQPVETPATISNRQKLRRHVRYVALNPSRARLANDPLVWIWSTYRELVGAAADPWVDVDRLCTRLGWSAARIHDYVSSDPHVRVDGTALPVAAGGQLELPIFTPRQIARACAAALRVNIEAMTERGPSRALFVVMMRDQGWHNLAAVGRHVGLSRSQTRKQSAPEQHVRAARMCLGDERLTNRVAERQWPETSQNVVFSASEAPQWAETLHGGSF